MGRRKLSVIKQDCFAFRNAEARDFCNALESVDSCVGCKFFKTKYELERQKFKCSLRLYQIGRVGVSNGGA